MPNEQVQHPLPEPVAITPALLKTHSITDEEYALIEQKLGRTPSLTELGIFSVMWSEHCSYKSSRVHLKRLPTKGTRTSGPGAVLQGPGENAGIIDVGDGWACAFKIESHNHPSYIEPYQGAATGVGGILRDIFTMGARPMAVMDSLRFGPLQPATKPGAPPSATVPSSLRVGEAAPIPDYARNRQTMRGVVHGVGGYGNCFGVPNLGGETRFEDCYSGNPLLNAFALGLVRTDEIFYAKAEGVGNPVFYVGAKTGRDGIHGATMASEEFTAGSEQKRPNVQMGDPFLEKLLLEACLEVMKTGAVLGIQDMGAAGLTCSTCEMGARGSLGVTIELDRVPQRETGMTSYEIMLSESQERMLLVAEKGREQEVLAVFEKWGLDCAEVGTVTADDVMRVYHGGVLQAEIPNKALTDEAPVYHRPVGTWNPPVPKDPPAWVLEELKKPRDYTADLLKLLASPNICSKHWIYEQYDSMVQTNTVQGPGGEAGVIRIKGTGTPDPATIPGAPSFESHPKGGVSSEARPLAPDFINAAAMAAPAEGLSPAAVNHSILGKLASFLSGSTPEGEATLLTGNEGAANPVVSATHGAASAVSPVEAGGFSPLNESAQERGFSPGEASTAPGLKPLSSDAVFSGLKPAASTLKAEATAKPERGLAMALAGNGRWCYLDPKLGAMHAVAEAARKVACTGATPVAATNCLNFGNPQKPEIMAQLSQAIDGIAEACTALGTPITGGNVSLYNETLGEGIYPTPVIGVVGILDDVTKAVPSAFQHEGDYIAVFSPYCADWDEEKDDYTYEMSLGSSAYAQVILGSLWGRPPGTFVEYDRKANDVIIDLARKGLLSSVSDVCDGGLAVAIAKACFPKRIGASIRDLKTRGDRTISSLFGETGGTYLLSLTKLSLESIRGVLAQHKIGGFSVLGQTGGALVEIKDSGNMLITATIDELSKPWLLALESQLDEEALV